MGKRIFIVMIFIFFVAGLLATFAIAADVPKMTKDELKAMLGNPDLIVMDVRLGLDWTGSDLKIQGAVREDPNAVESWANKYPKDKTFVFYCA
jgi:hypothetical protein